MTFLFPMETRGGEWGDHVTLQAAADSVWFCNLIYIHFYDYDRFVETVFICYTLQIGKTAFFLFTFLRSLLGRVGLTISLSAVLWIELRL